MPDQLEIVTIDGPSGVGKSTVSRKIANALGFTYLDTGAMYRGVALYLQRLGISLDNESGVEKALERLEMKLLPAADEESEVGVLVGEEDVSGLIRTPEMSMAASAVSALSPVRKKLTRMQQEIGDRGRVVAEGRDTGTVVFPRAAFKFYLDADPRERARRRVAQLREKGEIVDLEEILALTLERDRNDSERRLAPLKKAEDAVVVDTTRLAIGDVVAAILAEIERRRG